MILFVHFSEETLEDWTEKWKNECHNVRDPYDLVQDLSDRLINTKKILLNRKKVGGT